LGSFGSLKSFNLVKDSVTGNSKGFAFFEYNEPSITDRACAGLNNMKLGEKTILVQRANIGAKAPMPMPATESILINPTACNFLNLGMPIAAAAALLGLNINDPGSSSRIAVLLNMVSPHNLASNEEYDDLLEDVREECKKYGTVMGIHIPRPKPIQKDENGREILFDREWGVGKILIEFKKKEEAKLCVFTLGGKKFDGRTIIAGFFSEDRFAKKEFKPEEEEERRVAEKFRAIQEQKEREAKEAQERIMNEEY